MYIRICKLHWGRLLLMQGNYFIAFAIEEPRMLNRVGTKYRARAEYIAIFCSRRGEVAMGT